MFQQCVDYLQKRNLESIASIQDCLFQRDFEKYIALYLLKKGN